jgi:hypothetical protein
MSNYPDGMTARHWAYLDGDECEECEDDCTCDRQELTAEDIALENAGL